MPLLHSIAGSTEELEGSETVLDSSFPFTPTSSPPPAPRPSDSAELRQRPSTGQPSGSPRNLENSYKPKGTFLVRTQLPPDVNKNTEWFLYPGAWTMYFFAVLLAWLLILSVTGCSQGTAWTVVNLLHAGVSLRTRHACRCRCMQGSVDVVNEGFFLGHFSTRVTSPATGVHGSLPTMLTGGLRGNMRSATGSPVSPNRALVRVARLLGWIDSRLVSHCGSLRPEIVGFIR